MSEEGPMKKHPTNPEPTVEDLELGIQEGTPVTYARGMEFISSSVRKILQSDSGKVRLVLKNGETIAQTEVLIYG